MNERLLKSIAKRYADLDRDIRKGRLKLSSALDNYAHVITKDKLGLDHLGAALVGEIQDDVKAIPFIISVLDEDRDGDVVVPVGVKLKNYARNPVVFFGHQEWPVPIGVSREPGGQLAVFPQENSIKALWYADDEDPDAMFIYNKVHKGILSAASIAFVPLKARHRDHMEKAETHQGHHHKPMGWLFDEVDMTEWSIVGVPANAGALRDVFDTEGSFITPKMKKALVPYIAKSRGRCFSGWCPCPEPKTKSVRIKGIKSNRRLKKKTIGEYTYDLMEIVYSDGRKEYYGEVWKGHQRAFEPAASTVSSAAVENEMVNWIKQQSTSKSLRTKAGNAARPIRIQRNRIAVLLATLGGLGLKVASREPVGGDLEEITIAGPRDKVDHVLGMYGQKGKKMAQPTNGLQTKGKKGHDCSCHKKDEEQPKKKKLVTKESKRFQVAAASLEPVKEFCKTWGIQFELYAKGASKHTVVLTGPGDKIKEVVQRYEVKGMTTKALKPGDKVQQLDAMLSGMDRTGKVVAVTPNSIKVDWGNGRVSNHDPKELSHAKGLTRKFRTQADMESAAGKAMNESSGAAGGYLTNKAEDEEDEVIPKKKTRKAMEDEEEVVDTGDEDVVEEGDEDDDMEIKEEAPAQAPHGAHLLANAMQHHENLKTYLTDGMQKLEPDSKAHKHLTEHLAALDGHMEEMKSFADEHYPEHDMKALAGDAPPDEFADDPDAIDNEAAVVEGGGTAEGEEVEEEEGDDILDDEEDDVEKEEGDDNSTKEILDRYKEGPIKSRRRRKGLKTRKAQADMEGMNPSPVDKGGMDHSCVKDAAEFMEDLNTDEAIPKRYQGGLSFHAKNLGEYHAKAMGEDPLLTEEEGDGEIKDEGDMMDDGENAVVEEGMGEDALLDEEEGDGEIKEFPPEATDSKTEEVVEEDDDEMPEKRSKSGPSVPPVISRQWGDIKKMLKSLTGRN